MLEMTLDYIVKVLGMHFILESLDLVLKDVWELLCTGCLLSQLRLRDIHESLSAHNVFLELVVHPKG